MALELLKAKRVKVDRLITHRLKLAQIGEGFRIMTESRDSIKVIIGT